MQSLRELYKIGRGPSSSHTIGPEKACRIFMKRYPFADSYRAVLYDSLSKTGKGHGTDSVIRKTFAPKKCEILFDDSEKNLPHPNTMDLFAYKEDESIGHIRVMSVGGGSIVIEGEEKASPPDIYNLNTFTEIAHYCRNERKRIWQYVSDTEDTDFSDYMENIWKTMKKSIEAGLEDEGVLPGGLGVEKRAKLLFSKRYIDESSESRENRIVCSYAFAVGEQNACGETVVTAPTCGAAGIVPAVLYYEQQKCGFSDIQIIRALETGGIIGNLIKTNASISGAECGCQAEVGSACAMAAASLAELFELDTDTIEYAAEIAIEHHLGLTCDPIGGLVQIPCIERNAVAAMRAINAVTLSSLLRETRKISLDKVIKTMRDTGHDINNKYRETSLGGLAEINI